MSDAINGLIVALQRNGQILSDSGDTLGSILENIWDIPSYFFLLMAFSVLCLILERIWPWRQHQKLLRRQFPQDLVWLVFNGHFAGILVAHVATFLFAWATPYIDTVRSLNILSTLPIWLQFICFFLLKDFLEWIIHILLHRIPWLWEFHKLHHSIEHLDWVGNFRFHWMEIVIYQGLTYFPLVALGIDSTVILSIAVVATLIGLLNHSNINFSWGFLRYVLNSPRMHVWHHGLDRIENRPWGVNFAISLSIWDWIFGTAYWPSLKESPTQQPSHLGFRGMKRFPQSFLGRFFYPITRCLKQGRS